MKITWTKIKTKIGNLIEYLLFWGLVAFACAAVAAIILCVLAWLYFSML